MRIAKFSSPPSKFFFFILVFIFSFPLSAQIVIKDSVEIIPKRSHANVHIASTVAQTCYNIIYQLNAAAVKTPRPRIIFITDLRTDTLVYCTSVYFCGVSGVFANTFTPIGPVSDLNSQVTITYGDGPDASGSSITWYPTVEIRPTTTFRYDVKTLEVILRYDPVMVIPANHVFGYIHFRVAPVTPPTINITFPGADTTIFVTDINLPTIVLKEIHTPTDANVTWAPSNTISASDYITPTISEATVTVNATVTKNCGGEATATRRITFKSVLDHFKVTFEKDTVAFTESAKIFVQAKDKDNNDIELAADKLVKLSITANDEYGTFINQNADTLKTIPVELEHVRYGDAKAGLIQFAAVKKNPTDPVLSKVHVMLESDPTKEGEGEIPVVEQTLKIVMEGEREVVPRNLQGLRTAPAATNANKKEFKVQLTRNKAAVPNHPFKLTTDYVDGTGGHDHLTPRREENRNNYGYFILRRDGREYDRPYNGQTQNDGREIFDYVSSYFGDRMLLKVETTEPNKKHLLWDTLSIAEKVAGLTNFAAITSDIWRLTGNAGNTSYRRCRGTEIRHPSNHYGTSYTLRQLQLAIRDFAEWSGTEDGGGEYLILGINDMSLEYGGLFDICSTWIIGHTYHRSGASVDIDGRAQIFSSREFVSLQPYQIKKLEDIMRARQGTRYPEEPIHFGFGGK